MTFSTPRSLVLAALLGATLLACGTRTGLEDDAFHAVAAGGSGGTTGAAGTSAAGAGGSVAPDDACPSAVAGPRAMRGSCSTRDGRARVAAPTKPHVTWTKQLPTYDAAQLDYTRLATDDAGHAYLSTTASFSDQGDVRRVRTADGAVDWTTSIAPDSASDGVPVLLRGGGIQLFAYGPSNQESVLTLDRATGAGTFTTFGFELYDGPGDPAIGADGSVYLTHSTGVGTADPRTFLSRVRPDGTVAWSTPSLVTLLAGGTAGTSVEASLVALGPGGLVVLTVSRLSGPGDVVALLAFDADSGQERWATQGLGAVLGGPAVDADGTVVLLIAPTSTGGIPNLVSVAPSGAPESSSGLSIVPTALRGVTREGNLLVGIGGLGGGGGGLALIGPQGLTLWQRGDLDVRDASLAADGTIVAFDGKIVLGLDQATGATKWSLLGPSPNSYIGDLALTSDGGLVGIAGDGTLFGAGD